MVLPKKLSRDVSRPVSRLRLRGCRRRTPSSIGEISDRAVVDLGDDGSLPLDDDECSWPNTLPRPFVTRPLVSLYGTLVSL
jgi:hypothetical protein